MTAPETNHTFVVPAYGESEFLEDCLLSLKSQRRVSQIEITTSTPNPFIRSLAEKYSIPLSINTSGGSIGRDWNYAMSRVKTRYFTIAHQDDVYLPEYTSECLTAAEKCSKEHPLIILNTPKIFRSDTPVKLPVKNLIRSFLKSGTGKVLRSVKEKQLILRFANTISCPGVFFVRENLIDFQFNESEQYVLDWRAWWELSKQNGSFIQLDKTLHIHREHPSNASSTTGNEVLRLEEQQMLEEIWGKGFASKILGMILSKK